MKKVVLKLDFVDDKIKQKAMQKVSGLSGLESISFDSKEKKLTVTGDIDPVNLTSKLRKLCRAEIVTVGPAKEPEKKKEEPKKDDNQAKKDEPKKGDDKKKDGQKDDVAAKAYPLPPYYTYNGGAYYNQYQPPYQHHQPPPPYYGRSADEDPNSCVIC